MVGPGAPSVAVLSSVLCQLSSQQSTDSESICWKRCDQKKGCLSLGITASAQAVQLKEAACSSFWSPASLSSKLVQWRGLCWILPVSVHCLHELPAVLAPHVCSPCVSTQTPSSSCLLDRPSWGSESLIVSLGSRQQVLQVWWRSSWRWNLNCFVFSNIIILNDAGKHYSFTSKLSGAARTLLCLLDSLFFKIVHCTFLT